MTKVTRYHLRERPFNEEDIKEIRNQIASGKTSQKKMADALSVSRGTIWKIVERITYKDID